MTTSKTSLLLQLKQIDRRTLKYSAIVSAVIGGKGEYVSDKTNPIRSEMRHNTIYSSAGGRVNLSLFDISGRAVKVLMISSRKPVLMLSVSIGLLTRGIYYYGIQVSRM
jgi:hypothetical protein